MTITQEKLKSLVHYDPATGVFTWLVNRSPRVKAGDRAGTLREDGYRRLQVDGDRHYCSSLACLYMTGEMPEAEMDHIDRDRGNDAWSNLRPATKSQNCANRTAAIDPSHGLRGVTRRGKKFIAQIRVRGETIYLGMHDTAENAHAEYLKAAEAHFGEFAANDNAPAVAAA